jgi:hypothetical protein
MLWSVVPALDDALWSVAPDRDDALLWPAVEDPDGDVA